MEKYHRMSLPILDASLPKMLTRGSVIFRCTTTTNSRAIQWTVGVATGDLSCLENAATGRKGAVPGRKPRKLRVVTALL